MPEKVDWERRSGEHEKTEKSSNSYLYGISFCDAYFFFYIAKEENHNCTGEDCPVCACIHQAEQNLKNLGTGLAVAAMPGQKILPVLVAAFLVSCVVERFMGR